MSMASEIRFPTVESLGTIANKIIAAKVLLPNIRFITLLGKIEIRYKAEIELLKQKKSVQLASKYNDSIMIEFISNIFLLLCSISALYP